MSDKKTFISENQSASENQSVSEKQLVSVEHLSVSFGKVQAVRDVTFQIRRGEILGVVGESGSGKSVTALTLMGLLRQDRAKVEQGRIFFDGKELTGAGRLIREYQGNRMSMIFQEPMTSLNPTQRVGVQVEEMLKLHTGLEKKERYRRVCESFVEVGLKNPEKIYRSYPHQLSGGMRQRVMIAMAVILHPELLIADEPTTALDVTIQNQIIALLRDINRKEQNAMLFITHDLNLARRICNRLVVMKDGRIVESGPTEEIFAAPREPYTKMLIEAVPGRTKKRNWGQDPEQNRNLEPEQEPNQNLEQQNLEQNQKRHPVLQVEHLNVFYEEGGHALFGRSGKHCVVEDADFTVYEGEVLGLVGESGCGKSSLSKAILGMNSLTEGSVRHFSAYPQMIFQDPYSSLNPSKTIGWLLKEPLRARRALESGLFMTEEEMEREAVEMLQRIGLDESYMNRKPSQLSGGQRQRISIGQALITRPAFVIADEPVSALDVTMQVQIMELMKKLQHELKVSYLFISHDINIVYQMSDRIMVMKDGKIIEQGDTEQVFREPKEEYTRLLLKES